MALPTMKVANFKCETLRKYVCSDQHSCFLQFVGVVISSMLFKYFLNGFETITAAHFKTS